MKYQLYGLLQPHLPAHNIGFQRASVSGSVTLARTQCSTKWLYKVKKQVKLIEPKTISWHSPSQASRMQATDFFSTLNGPLSQITQVSFTRTPHLFIFVPAFRSPRTVNTASPKFWKVKKHAHIACPQKINNNRRECPSQMAFPKPKEKTGHTGLQIDFHITGFRKHSTTLSYLVD